LLAADQQRSLLLLLLMNKRGHWPVVGRRGVAAENGLGMARKGRGKRKTRLCLESEENSVIRVQGSAK